MESKNSNTSEFNPSHYRLFDSKNYRKKVKRLVEMVKYCRNITSFPRPAPQLKSNATANERAKRMDFEDLRLSSNTMHWFAQPYESQRNSQQSSSKMHEFQT